MKELLTACLTLSQFASFADADVVVMQSGKMHEGTVTGFDGTDLTIKISDGKVILEKPEVASVHFGITLAEYRKQLASAPSTPTKEPRDNGAVKFGDSASVKHISIKVTRAWVGKPNVFNRITNRTAQAINDTLIVRFEIENTDERRIARRMKNALGSHFLMEDDVENVIRWVNFGFSDNIEGTMSTNADLLPMRTATHDVAFQVPPPKTKSLTAFVDMRAFGESGRLAFLIPIEKVEGFKAEK